jgi:hypothetical protein
VNEWLFPSSIKHEDSRVSRFVLGDVLLLVRFLLDFLQEGKGLRFIVGVGVLPSIHEGGGIDGCS